MDKLSDWLKVILVLAAFFGGVAGLLFLVASFPWETRITILMTAMAIGCVTWLYHDTKGGDWPAPSLAFFGMPFAIGGSLLSILMDLGVPMTRPVMAASIAFGLAVPALVMKAASGPLRYEAGRGMKVWWGICIAIWIAMMLYLVLRH